MWRLLAGDREREREREIRSERKKWIVEENYYIWVSQKERERWDFVETCECVSV